MGKDEGPKCAGHAVGSETALLRLDSEADWTSEGVHSGRDGKGNYPRSHNLETGADPRSGNDPESTTGAFGRCVTPQEGKLVRRACRAAASLGKESS